MTFNARFYYLDGSRWAKSGSIKAQKMVHDVAVRREAKDLKKRARKLAGEARAFEGIE